MISNPKVGQLVQVWYANKCKPRELFVDAFPLHGKLGRVAVVSRGKPRNHGVEIEGTLHVVPCGNLRGAFVTTTAELVDALTVEQLEDQQ